MLFYSFNSYACHCAKTIKNYADHDNVLERYMIFVKKVRSSERLVMKIVEN
jgi:hypothetical protein